MSDPDGDSFIREVSEEVRQDRLYALWKKYGALAIGGIAALVAGSVAWNWYTHAQEQAARARGGTFLSAGDGVEGAEGLVETVEGPAAVLADLRLAAAYARSGNRGAAAERYAAVADMPGIGPAYAQFARLQQIRMLAETRPPPDSIQALTALVQPGAPYRLLALELRASLRLNIGEVAAAHEDLNAILASPDLTRGLNARARQMLAATGGRFDPQAQ